MSITVDDDAPNRKLDGLDRHAGPRRPADEDRVPEYPTEALVDLPVAFRDKCFATARTNFLECESRKIVDVKRNVVLYQPSSELHRTQRFFLARCVMHRQRALLLVALVLLVAASAYAQVTTATLVGLVRDNSGAVIPGASVIATHEGTGVAREGVSDANGEFVLAALPNGPYTVRIELTGFKTISQRGIELGAGQTVRQTFVLEVGAMSETVTVTGDAPLVQTAMSLQADSLGSQEVRELPVNRRNIQNLIGLTAGVVITGTGAAGGSGGVQMNGVASGGTGITVDGTEANSNPEGRSLTQYGSENQISVMSLDSIAEVQIVKGVLPAEYGGVAGGQINVISRSGTNIFHGSAFYSGQKEKWNARDFFSTAQKPVGAVQSVRRHTRWSGAAEQGVLLRHV